MWHIKPLPFLLAMILDLLLGDPRGWPHLARLTGRVLSPSEKIITSLFGRTILAGTGIWLTVLGLILSLYFIVFFSLEAWHPLLAQGLVIFVTYQTLAARDLHHHVVKIIRPLAQDELLEARRNLAMIVGRDTSELDETEIARASIESVAESITDGIVAPLFWAVVAGAPGALLYRVSNTLDSLIGHRNKKYERVGKLAARIDDILTWAPARLTALMFWLWRPTLDLCTVIREAATHASPNAGWSESAMAHVLNVRLGGANWYEGERISGPIFNTSGREPHLLDLRRALVWMWKTTGLFFSLCFAVIFFRNHCYVN